MSIDSIGNFLTIIRNGIMASKPFVMAPHSKMSMELMRILKEEGFIKNFEVDSSDAVIKKIKVVLKYVQGESVIHKIVRVSTPGRRVYAKVKNVKPVVGGFGISILSTNRGLMTDKQAKEPQLGLGGEVVCKVW
jgi:small subunit ribosomal protein S8